MLWPLCIGGGNSLKMRPTLLPVKRTPEYVNRPWRKAGFTRSVNKRGHGQIYTGFDLCPGGEKKKDSLLVRPLPTTGFTVYKYTINEGKRGDGGGRDICQITRATVEPTNRMKIALASSRFGGSSHPWLFSWMFRHFIPTWSTMKYGKISEFICHLPWSHSVL